MTQNVYDDPHFFAGYATLDRSTQGLEGAPEWPSLRALLPTLTGKRIADLGCGYGWFCRYAREAGAASITGFDVSQKMLEQARAMTPDDVIAWQHADLETLTLPENSLDLIWSSLTLHYLKAIPALFSTIHQALVPGGMLIFSAEHPIYTAPLAPGWGSDAEGRRSWPVNHYQQEGERINHWFNADVRKQHRKLATWINLVLASGLELIHLDEWGPTAEQITAAPQLAEEADRPMFFLLAARRPYH
jgi:SAM-dependent methyltransferase